MRKLIEGIKKTIGEDEGKIIEEVRQRKEVADKIRGNVNIKNLEKFEALSSALMTDILRAGYDFDHDDARAFLNGVVNRTKAKR